MKVIDILNHKDFHFNQSLIEQSSIRISDKSIDANLNIALNTNEEIECIYYWYDHLYRKINPKALGTIQISIQNHEWETFQLYYLNKIQTPCDLPNEFVIFTKDTDILLGHMDLNEETFKFITFNEYECG